MIRGLTQVCRRDSVFQRLRRDFSFLLLERRGRSEVRFYSASVGIDPVLLGDTNWDIREEVIANCLRMGGKPLLRPDLLHLLEARRGGCLTCGVSGFRWIGAFGFLSGRDDVLEERLEERALGLAGQTLFGRRWCG